MGRLTIRESQEGCLGAPRHIFYLLDEKGNPRKTIGWQQQYEPHTIHVKGADDLGQKLGKLIGKTRSLAHEASGALQKKRDKKREIRTWVLDHKKLREYFHQHEVHG